MSPRTWWRLRPRWARDVMVLMAWFSVVLATTLWASRRALVGVQSVVAEPDIPTWARLVFLGVSATVAVMLWVLRTGMTVRRDIADQFKTMTSAQDAMGEKINRIDGALTGYNGFGGIMPRLQVVESEVKTVDERIRKRAHDLRDELTAILMRSHDEIGDRVKQVAEELRDFKEEVRAR